MFNTEIVIFDLEYGDQTMAYADNTMPCILEIGALRVTLDGNVAGKYSTLVYPTEWRHVTPRILNLTGIEKEELETAPAWKDVYPDFVEFVRRTVLASWSAIDPILLRYQCGFAGFDVLHSNKCLDLATVWQERAQLARAAWSLKAVCKHLHLNPPGHRALEDCKSTLNVFHASKQTEEQEVEDEEFEIFEF